MERHAYSTSPGWWGPRLSRFWIGLIRPVRFFWQRFHEGLYSVEIRGLEHLRGAIDRGDGVLVVTNHPANPDPFVFLKVGDRLGVPMYYMAAWQVFERQSWLNKRILRRHGCFSVNREGDDPRAVRQAVAVLRQGPHPLVMFPEGELYHTSDYVHPFRTGTAAIALTAAHRAKRRVVCVPTAIRYYYRDDPTPQLAELVGRLERRAGWPAPPGLNLAARVYRFAERLIATREWEFLEGPRSGPLPPRLAALTEAVLNSLKAARGGRAPAGNFTDRVIEARRSVLPIIETLPASDPRAQEARRDLDRLRLAMQLYSYIPDYADDQPTVERLAEILDKFEEDVLDAFWAAPRGKRDAVISFGSPFEIEPAVRIKDGAADLTRVMEKAVRAQLADIVAREPGRPRLDWSAGREQGTEWSDRGMDAAQAKACGYGPVAVGRLE